MKDYFSWPLDASFRTDSIYSEQIKPIKILHLLKEVAESSFKDCSVKQLAQTDRQCNHLAGMVRLEEEDREYLHQLVQLLAHPHHL